MQIVHAKPEDARAVAEIHVDSWRASYASIVPADYLASLSVERRKTMWDECIATGVPELLVAREASVVQGWVCFGQCRDEGSSKAAAEIWAIYVAPSSWSTGVGRLLWLQARELMLAQGFKSCSLWVFPQNDRAIKFYRSAGFAHDGSAPKRFELGGTQLQEVRFVAQLDD
jgi:L-amino acid N-acyltransferase YncA